MTTEQQDEVAVLESWLNDTGSRVTLAELRCRMFEMKRPDREQRRFRGFLCSFLAMTAMSVFLAMQFPSLQSDGLTLRHFLLLWPLFVASSAIGRFGYIGLSVEWCDWRAQRLAKAAKP